MIRKTLALMLLALGIAACPSQPPADIAKDCPKTTDCGKCALTPGCAWCGKECIALGRKECPSGVIRHQYDCPVTKK